MAGGDVIILLEFIIQQAIPDASLCGFDGAGHPVDSLVIQAIFEIGIRVCFGVGICIRNTDFAQRAPGRDLLWLIEKGPDRLNASRISVAAVIQLIPDAVIRCLIVANCGVGNGNDQIMPVEFGAFRLGIGLIECPNGAINDATLQTGKIILLREMGGEVW